MCLYIQKGSSELEGRLNKLQAEFDSLKKQKTSTDSRVKKLEVSVIYINY